MDNNLTIGTLQLKRLLYSYFILSKKMPHQISKLPFCCAEGAASRYTQLPINLSRLRIAFMLVHMKFAVVNASPHESDMPDISYFLLCERG